MNNFFIRFQTLFSPRIPHLYFGPRQVETQLSGRGRFAENLYIFLKVISETLIIIGAVVGYLAYKYYGLLLGAMLGYGLGSWIRRSLGVRGNNPTLGFFRRMRERANGRSPGLLESWIERLGGFSLSREKCHLIAELEERSIKQLKRVSTSEEKNRILSDLDRKVRLIAYR